MRGVRAGGAAALVPAALLVLVACTPPSQMNDGSAFSPPSGESDVDTPELRELRSEAGLDPCPAPGEADPRGVGGGDDALVLPCLGGGDDVEVTALTGEPTVVNLWASWCTPCRDELPVLQQLHETGAVRVLGVDFADRRPAEALELLAEAGVTYASVSDPASDSREVFGQRALPTTVFVDADGEITGSVSSEYTDLDELVADVETYLGVTP